MEKDIVVSDSIVNNSSVLKSEVNDSIDNESNAVRFRFYSHSNQEKLPSDNVNDENVSENSPVLHSEKSDNVISIDTNIRRRYHIFAALGDDIHDASSLANYSKRFYIVFTLTAVYMLVEFIVGILIGSLALYADAIHMLSDLVALAVGYYSIQVVNRPATPQATFGFQRMEVLGGLINAVFLLSLCFTIVIDALQRLFNPNSDEQQQLRDNAQFLCIVASIGFGINFVGMLAFGGHGHSHSHSHSHSDSHSHHSHGHGHGHKKSQNHQSKEEKHESETESDDHEHDHDHDDHESSSAKSHDAGNLNIRALFMHALGDALGSVAVIISGICIIFIDSSYAVLSDPLSSLFITIMIMLGSIPIFRSSLRILLHEVPTSINTDSIRNLVLQSSGVLNVHDLHVWPITPGRLVCSMHILFDVNIVSTTSAFMRISDKLKPQLHAIGIHLSTIQPEFTSDPLLLTSKQTQEKLNEKNQGGNKLSQDESHKAEDYCHEPICQPKPKPRRKSAKNTANKLGKDHQHSTAPHSAGHDAEESKQRNHDNNQNENDNETENDDIADTDLASPSGNVKIGMDGTPSSQAAVACIQQSCCNTLSHRRSEIKTARA